MTMSVSRFQSNSLEYNDSCYLVKKVKKVLNTVVCQRLKKNKTKLRSLTTHYVELFIVYRKKFVILSIALWQSHTQTISQRSGDHLLKLTLTLSSCSYYYFITIPRRLNRQSLVAALRIAHSPLRRSKPRCDLARRHFQNERLP